MKSLGEERLLSLKQELASINNQAITVTGEIKLMVREMESLKPDVIRKRIEDQRKILARQRGFSAFAGDERAKRLGLVIGIGGAFLGGLLSKDPVIALNAGISGFDGLVRGMGETKWYIDLNERISVVPQEKMNARGNCISWENMMADLESMKKNALVGERLGSFDNIITTIRHRYQPK